MMRTKSPGKTLQVACRVKHTLSCSVTDVWIYGGGYDYTYAAANQMPIDNLGLFRIPKCAVH